MTAHEQGQIDAARGIALNACPYAAGTFDRQQWEAGWSDLTDNPHTLTAYKLGRIAAAKNADVAECPFGEGTFDRDQWHAGHREMTDGTEGPKGHVLSPAPAKIVLKPFGG